MKAIKELKLNTDGEIANLNALLGTGTTNTTSALAQNAAEISVLGAKTASLEASLNQLIENTSLTATASVSATISDLVSRMTQAENNIAGIQSRLDFIEQYVASEGGVLGVATPSATLATNISAETLDVSGATNLNDLGVTGTITTGFLTINGYDDTLATPSASLSTVGGPLSLQPMALENIEIMGDKIHIDTLGNMKVEAQVTAKTVRTEKLEIVDTISPETVEATVAATTKSIGEATIPAGQTELVIPTAAVTAHSFIFVTPKTAVPVSIAVVEQLPGGSFKVQITSPQPTDVKFNWWIVN